MKEIGNPSVKKCMLRYARRAPSIVSRLETRGWRVRGVDGLCVPVAWPHSARLPRRAGGVCNMDWQDTTEVVGSASARWIDTSVVHPVQIDLT
jgi:hypothetical protein